jgi:hypothetical protein
LKRMRRRGFGVIFFWCSDHPMRWVADDIARTIRWCRIEAVGMKVRLSASDEEGTCLVQQMQAREIDVAAIHDVGRPRLGQQEIEGMNVVQFTLGDVRRSSRVCIFTAALVERKCAPGNSDRHKSMVVEFRA